MTTANVVLQNALGSSADERLPVQLFVLERREQTSDCLSFRSKDAARTCIVTRDPGERPVELALRTIRRVAAIEASSAQVTLAVLALDGWQEGQVAAARRLTAMAVLSHMAARGSGKLVLAVRQASESDIHGVMDFTGRLLLETAGSGVAISLRFGAAQTATASDATTAPRAAAAQSLRRAPDFWT